MKNFCLVVAILFVAAIGAALERSRTPTDNDVVRLDPALDSVISTDAKVELVKGGFGLTEGPNWVQKGKTGYLVFSDIPANVIYKMTPDGNMSVLVDQSGYRGPWNGYTMLTVGGPYENDPADPFPRQFINIGSNGLTLDPQGRLIVCAFGGRYVYRIEKNGERTVLADHYRGKRLSSPNDVVAKNDGAIYFSNTIGGLRGLGKDPSKETDPAIFMIKDGNVTEVVDDIPSPNGFAFSPDEKYFYANGSRANYIRRYDVQPDDTLRMADY